MSTPPKKQPTRRGRVPKATRDQVDAALNSGAMTYQEIIDTFGVSRSYVGQRRKALTRETSQPRAVARGKDRYEMQMDAANFPPPIPLDQLGPEALRALEDIGYFAERYYGIVLLPWQVIAAQKIKDLLATPYEEFAAINVAPGTGKTAFFARILPAWLTCRDRSMRGMLGSATNTVAKRSNDLLRKDFTRDRPDIMNERDFKQGLVQAESVLSLDFGRFRPDVDGHLWTREAFEVAQHGDTSLTSKEPTWQAFGRDTTFIGMRVDFANWDDLWDPRKVRSADAREDFFAWFDDVAEARLEPGGLFLLQGQRLDPNDIFRYALDKRDIADHLDEFERIPGDVESSGRKYHHIVFKAYDETKDTGDPALLRPDAPPWPEGPLLSPFRLKWKKLRQIRENTPDTFSLVYQQEDADLESTLVNPLWIEGGQAPDGEWHIGCRDNERKMFEPPEYLKPPVVSVAMTDPSHVNMWANVWQLWQVGEEEVSEDIRHVMALKASRMTAPEFLTYNHLTGTFSGLMEEWWQISKEVGYPIQHWIVEQNGAQRYLLQHQFVHEWMQLRGVRIHGHTTGRLKSDPELGVQSLSPVFRNGLIRLPMKDAMIARGPGKDPHMYELIKQVTQYPYGSKDDIAMALWFFEVNKDKLRPPKFEGGKMSRPSFLRVFDRRAA